MPPQKTGRGRKKTRGGRGGGRAGGSSKKKINTPAPDESHEEPIPQLIVRLKAPRELLQDYAAAEARAPAPEADVDEENDDVAEELPVVTTRSGRVVTRKQEDDFLYSEDYQSQLASSPAQKASDNGGESTYQYRGRGRTSTPAIFNFPSQAQSTAASRRSNKRGAGKANAFTPSLPALPEVPGLPVHDIPLEIQDRAANIINMLAQTQKIQIDLPELSYSNETTQPYSPQLLMAIYLSAYSARNWDVCDMVADTWIRAFHSLRRREEKSGKGRRRMTWRYNAPLTKMREVGIRGYEAENGKGAWKRVLVVQDPDVEVSVTFPPADLLNLLYTSTHPEAGARLLWADALALTGDWIEARLNPNPSDYDYKGGRKSKGASEEQFHPDLIREIACTSLRLQRRKLTLKIEEATEGAWCKRYHEHGRHGVEKCYRERAYERKVAGLDEPEVISDEDDDGGEEMVGVVMGGAAGAGKGEGEGMATGNTVRFAETVPEVEVFDVDAEGETDDG